MAGKHKVTVSINPPTHRLTTAERRRAYDASIATKQQELKRETEQRRAQRAQREGVGAS